MRLSRVLDHFGSIKALANALELNPSTVQVEKIGISPREMEAVINELMLQSQFQKVEPKHVSVDSIIAQHGSVKAVAQLLK